MFIKANKRCQLLLEFSMIVLGTLIMGFSFSVFLEPNNISTGGFSALSMIVNAILFKIGIKFIPTSVIYLILNIGLYFLALHALGKRFAIKALVGILSFSLGIQIFSMIDFKITYELVVSAIFGGAIMGAGVGLVVRFGGSTGGTDMIACILKKKKPTATFGSLIIIIDMFIITLSLFVFSNGFALLPYTILALVLCMLVTDFVNEGYKQVRAFYIITDKPEEISESIMKNLARGCSCTKIKGMHSSSEKFQVTCLISKYQTGQLRSIIKEIDADAFVYSTKIAEVVGAWNSFSDIQKMKESENIDSKKPSKASKKMSSQTKSDSYSENVIDSGNENK